MIRCHRRWDSKNSPLGDSFLKEAKVVPVQVRSPPAVEAKLSNKRYLLKINNVANKFPVVVKKMETMIKAAHLPNKDWPLLPDELKGSKAIND